MEDVNSLEILIGQITIQKRKRKNFKFTILSENLMRLLNHRVHTIRLCFIIKFSQRVINWGFIVPLSVL